MTVSLQPLHTRSPLLYSSVLSNKLGAHVYLKLDNTQPSGSFKTRGIGHLAQRSVSPLGPSHTHLVCSSGGNAGLACAHAALALGTKCTIFVPVTTTARVVERLRSMGAEVVHGGANLAEADLLARERLKVVEGGVHIPPYDHPLIVDGHSTLVFELEEQLTEHQASPLAAVVCSAGGGGLLGGIIKGMAQTSGRLDCPIIACETSGAASLAAALSASHAAGEPTLARLPSINTIATSIGASQVSAECLERCLQHDAKTGLVSVVMEDARALDIVRQFTDDHAFFVEPACAASLAPVYAPAILQAALPSLALATLGRKPPPEAPSIVVVVCGGNTMSLEMVHEWERRFAGQGLGEVRVMRKGREEVVKD